MTTNNVTNARQVTKYTHTTRTNFTDWKRDVDAMLSAHPDKLLTVVQDGALAISTKIKLKSQYKSVREEWTSNIEREHVMEMNTTAYHLILPTIGDATFRKHIERKYGGDNDAASAYGAVLKEWELGMAATDERIVAKDAERKALLDVGAKSGSLANITDFVESLLALNNELHGTDFYWGDTALVTYVLNAVAVHNDSFVSGYKGTKVGNSTWKKDFDVVWSELRTGLESNNATKDANMHRQSDVLRTSTEDDTIKVLVAQVTALTEQVRALQGTSVLATAGSRCTVKCEHCGHVHWPNKKYGCIGKALAEGKATMNEAKAVFKNFTDPENAALMAKERYMTYNKDKTGVDDASATTRPTRSVTFMVRSAGGKDKDVLRVDTQAEDTILNDARYFNDIDHSIVLKLSTITPGGAEARTVGRGTARMQLTDGTIMTIHNAHLYPEGTANVLATRNIADKAVIDFNTMALRLRNGELLPFDAGYCSFYVHPCGLNIIKATHRHPEATSAILNTGVRSFFGGITGGPRNASGTSELSPEELGFLYKRRTALGARRIKDLPDSTNAPQELKKIPQHPSNDSDALRANMPKMHAKARDTPRRKVVCFDLQGPFAPSKHGDNRYVAGFYILDEPAAERCIHLEFMPAKDKFPEHLENFLNTRSIGKDYQLFTDNEIVLNSQNVKKILRSRQMKPLRNSCEYEPWQNPAERPWRTLTASTREFLLRGFGDVDSDNFDPSTYWPYAHQQAADIENAINNSESGGRIAHFRVPFCLAYVKTPNRYRDGKLAPQAEVCMHLGYSRSKHGYVLEVIAGPRKGRIITSTQVKFREDIFPMHALLRHDQPQPNTIALWYDIPDDSDSFGDDVDMPGDSQAHGDEGDDHDDESDDNDDNSYDPSEARDDDSEDFSSGPHNMNTRGNGDPGEWRDIYNALEKGRRDGTIRVLASDSTTPNDPKWAPKRFANIETIPDKKLRNDWYGAHYEENDGLFDKPDVLRMVPMPAGVTNSELMYLHTIYTVKSDGRKKARTVLGAGKEKLEGLNLGYDRSFSPTARSSTVRLLCALAAERNDTIRGGDVKQAFVQGEWPEHIKKVLAHMPAGYNKHYDGKAYCCEVGNLYGHPIAGRNWFHTFRNRMRYHGYTQSKHDPCLFYKFAADDHFYLVLYVDDILTFTSDSKLYDEWNNWFSGEFKWTNFDTNLHEFTSLNITQSPGKVTIDMKRYIADMLAEHFPGGVHHAYTVPADTDLANVVHKAACAKDTTYSKTEVGALFRRLCMQLLYCAHQARPDIAISVGLLTRVQAWPSPDLLKRAERVLIYLSGTMDMMLTYTASGDIALSIAWAPRVTLVGVSDASFGLAHSTSGYAFFISGAAIMWSTKKQATIALSTYEAEVVAGSMAACAAVAIRGILGEVRLAQTEPTMLYMDSSSAIDLANDPMHYDKSKHIARRDLFIRELVENNVIKTKFIPTAKNSADALTKPLYKAPFIAHRAKLLGI